MSTQSELLADGANLATIATTTLIMVNFLINLLSHKNLSGKHETLLLSLKTNLETSSTYFFNSSRSGIEDLSKLLETKKIIESIYVVLNEMPSSQDLNEALVESLCLFQRLHKDQTNPANKPYFIAAELITLWNISGARQYNLRRLDRILCEMGSKIIKNSSR